MQKGTNHKSPKFQLRKFKGLQAKKTNQTKKYLLGNLALLLEVFFLLILFFFKAAFLRKLR